MIQQFFKYRYQLGANSPQHSLLIYAGDEETAREKAFNRLARDYGPDGFTLHRRVEDFGDDFQRADLNAGRGQGLFSALSREDVESFLDDYEASQPAPEPKPAPPARVRKLGDAATPKPKRKRLSSIEAQIQARLVKRRSERLTTA